MHTSGDESSVIGRHGEKLWFLSETKKSSVFPGDD